MSRKQFLAGVFGVRNMAKKPGWPVFRTPDGKIHPYQPALWQKSRWKAEEFTAVDHNDCEFDAAMKFDYVSEGHFYFKHLETSEQFLIQETEMGKIIANHYIEKGLIFGHWGWVKRGRVVSIKLINELEDEEEESDGQD